MPDISLNPVVAGLVPARVSGNRLGVTTTGGHKTLPYDVVAEDCVFAPGDSSIDFAAASSSALMV